MANPPLPTNPDITPGAQSGRLATDRYDFQAHIQGNGFRHQASQMDLFPTVVIAGNTVSTVQNAIAALAAITSPPVITQATNSQLGVVQLKGDLGGVATQVQVTGLQGKPVSTLTPLMGNILTWNGLAWQPSAPAGAFVANGDLLGTSLNQQVANLSGSSGVITISGHNLTFNSTVSNPTISQAITTGSANNLFITAQSTSTGGFDGGSVVISGGVAGSGPFAHKGGVILKLNGSSGYPLLQLTEPTAGQRVLSLVNTTATSSTNMPANTGDSVIFVADTASPPTSGSPTGGTILYSSGGQLFVKQSNGSNFAIGTEANPDIWGPVGNQTYTTRNSSQTTTNIAAVALTFDLTTVPNASINVAINVVGKAVGAADTVQYFMTMGYLTDGAGNPTAVGSNTSVYGANLFYRTTAGASGWTAPSIGVSGTNLLVNSGCNSATTINWFIVTKLTISTG